MAVHSSTLRLVQAIEQFKAAHSGDEALSDIVGSLDEIATKIGGDDGTRTQESPGSRAAGAASQVDTSALAEKIKSIGPPKPAAQEQPNDFAAAAQKAVDVLTQAIAGAPGPDSGTAPPAGGEA